jgi:hypothetical protein
MSPIIENRFESLIKMEMQFKPIQLESILYGVKSTPEQVNLALSIYFGEYTLTLKDGRKISLRLKRGELRLNLENCRIALSNIKLKDELPVKIEEERQREKSSEAQAKTSVSVNLGATTTKKDGTKESQKIKVINYLIKLKWSSDCPYWEFICQGESAALEGALDCDLAIMDILNNPCQLWASFESPQIENIYVNIPGNWLKKNLPSLKEKLTKQGVSKIFSNNLHQELENTLKLKSYLSRVEWSYG